jgi:hypothetical protein
VYGLPNLADEAVVGSPMKKHRGSVHGSEQLEKAGLGFPIADVVGAKDAVKTTPPSNSALEVKMDEEEEL